MPCGGHIKLFSVLHQSADYIFSGPLGTLFLNRVLLKLALWGVVSIAQDIICHEKDSVKPNLLFSFPW